MVFVKIFSKHYTRLHLHNRCVVADYFQGDEKLPRGTKSLSSSEVLRYLLLEREYIKPWICQKQPLSVNRNTTFIIDLSKLPSRKDIFADDMGVWKHLGSPSQYFQVKKTDSGGLKEVVSLGKKKLERMSCDVYRIWKNYSIHHAASDLSRTVIFLEGIKKIITLKMYLAALNL